MTYVYMGIATVLIVAGMVIIGNWIWDGYPPTDSDTDTKLK